MCNPDGNSPEHVVCHPGQGRTLVIGGVSITFKVTGRETDNALTVFEVTLPPLVADTFLHVHRPATAAFWVIEGTLAVTMDEDTFIARAGSFLSIPPGTSHTFWNPTATPVIYLAICSPAGIEHHLEGLATTEPFCAPAGTGKVESLGVAGDVFPVFTQS